MLEEKKKRIEMARPIRLLFDNNRNSRSWLMRSEILRKTFADALTSRRFLHSIRSNALYNANIGKIILLEEKRIVLKNGEAYSIVIRR